MANLFSSLSEKYDFFASRPQKIVSRLIFFLCSSHDLMLFLLDTHYSDGNDMLISLTLLCWSEKVNICIICLQDVSATSHYSINQSHHAQQHCICSNRLTLSCIRKQTLLHNSEGHFLTLFMVPQTSLEKASLLPSFSQLFIISPVCFRWIR